MSRPLLSIVTRTCRRPTGLARTIESVLAQTSGAFEQVFLVDESGNHPQGNIAWANGQFYRNRMAVRGRYVMALDDDGILVDARFVERLAEHVSAKPTVAVLLRCASLDADGKVVYLPPAHIWGLDWEHGQRPGRWAGNGYNWAVKLDVWRKCVLAYMGHNRGGDWHFATGLIQSGATVSRLEGCVGGKSLGRGKGEVFETCEPGWFLSVARKYGMEQVKPNVWRMVCG